MPPEGWAALRMFVPMPPPKQINRFHKVEINLFLLTSVFNQIWARPPATMVAETASIVIGGGQ
jgi:hypothetical protein